MPDGSNTVTVTVTVTVGIETLGLVRIGEVVESEVVKEGRVKVGEVERVDVDEDDRVKTGEAVLVKVTTDGTVVVLLEETVVVVVRRVVWVFVVVPMLVLCVKSQPLDSQETAAVSRQSVTASTASHKKGKSPCLFSPRRM